MGERGELGCQASQDRVTCCQDNVLPRNGRLGQEMHAHGLAGPGHDGQMCVVEEDSALIKRKGSLDDARAVRTDGQARLEMDDHRALAFLTLLTGLGGQATSPVAGVEPRRTG